MAKFDMNNPFIADDFDDAVDLVLMTDEDIAAAEEKSEENADKSIEGDATGVIDALKESGVVPYDCDPDDEPDVEYDEELDDECDVVGCDAADYREVRDTVSDVEDEEEDDLIDAIIDGEE